MKILIFGHSGLIGSAVSKKLEAHNFEIVKVSRNTTADIFYDIETNTPGDLNNLLISINPEYVLNFAGKVRQRIKNTEDEVAALKQNVIFPAVLDNISTSEGYKTISVATDCVFSGETGNYSENSSHDGLDVYSQTKSLGEKFSPNTMLLRTSVIGLGNKGGVSLVEWFNSLARNSICEGYTNHLWNGITNVAIADIILGIITNNNFFGGIQHIVPEGVVSKFELLSMINEKLKKEIQIIPKKSEFSKNMCLKTRNKEINERIWSDAGYVSPPSIQEMINSLK